MRLMVLVVVGMMMVKKVGSVHDYGEALSKSILFFEGQRSGKLPPTQRMTGGRILLFGRIRYRGTVLRTKSAKRVDSESCRA